MLMGYRHDTCVCRYTSALVTSRLTVLPLVMVATVIKLIEYAPGKTSPLDIMPTYIMKAFKDAVAVMIANVANISFRTA